jgi:hypothetical protein
MNCLCGHPDTEHVRGGRCRVPDCPCEWFQPGDTLREAMITEQIGAWRVEQGRTFVPERPINPTSAGTFKP